MRKTVSYLQRGFTLVELLIVVIILALLAAIVVPQFASTTDDAREASLDTNLANLRAAIDLYYQQHGEFPGANTAVPAAGCAAAGAVAGAGAAGSAQAFLSQLSLYTDGDGAACSQQDGGNFTFGPYLKKDTLPDNPITNDNTLDVVSDGNLVMTGDAAGAGWKFDSVSGKFIADDARNDPSGNPYDKR